MPLARRRRRLVLAAFVGAALYVTIANAVVCRGARVVPVAEAAPAPVIVVLGAGIRPDGSPSDILADRLDTALEIHRLRRGRILCSGDHGRDEHDEPLAMARYLEARGVAPEAIFLDHAGFDSFNTVSRARRVFGITRAVFVSQAYHLPRVLWTAKEEGIEAEGVAADRHTYPGLRWYQAREVVSRSKAVLDVAVGREPHFLGPHVNLDGDGRSTRQ